MSGKEMSELLHEMFRSEDAPPLTNAVVDSFLALPEAHPEEQIQRMRARFIEKLLAEVHPEPVRTIKEKLPFGRWVEVARLKAKLTRADLASVIGVEPSHVGQVETGDIAPHELPGNELGRLIQLFRLHIDVMRDLLLTSMAVARTRADLGVAGRLTPGNDAKKTAEAMKLTLDMFLADTAEIDPNAEPEVENCLTAIRGYLEGRQARELLD